MKLIFAGTPEFSAVALSALLAAEHEVSLVLTQPDRPAGRGMLLQASPVKQLALVHGIPVYQPPTLKDVEVQAVLRATAADAMVVAAYGLILPQVVLDMPKLGCFNIHASLLPRWRGAAPIQRAILAGDTQTGVCIMQMEAGLDTGPVLLSEGVDISAEDTATTLHDRLAAVGGRLIVSALGQLPLPAKIQPVEGVTYAAKIEKAESAIDWARSAEELGRHVRAFNPFPGAATSLDGVVIKVWQAAVENEACGIPGQVLAADHEGIVVACATGGLRIQELQKAGGKRLSAKQFLAGHTLLSGARFCPVA